jgi:hypothetical protein
MNTNVMITAASGLSVCAAIACGSDHDDETAGTVTTTDATLENQPGLPSGTPEAEPGSLPVSETGICNNLLHALDIPFGVAVFAATDACPSQRRGAAPLPSTTVADVRRDAAGKYCVKGVLKSGLVLFIVSYDHINDIPARPFHEPLDAAARGITQYRFTLESPPPTGLQVSPSNVVGDQCPFSSSQCIQAGFYVLDEAGLPITITRAGTYTQRIADLRPGPWVPPTLALDTTRLAGFEFQINPGEFDLCVSDLQLLDDAGNPVSEPE